MQNNIFIPDKINVGFQKREDTYTGKLAYVVYFDKNGVLRKEKSWESWRDKTIANEVYDNAPLSGFVLNKRVGDYKSGWNHRQSYVRIYDPRGFEFELTIPNLLYILENTNCIKGKGLEGDFVYGYCGSDLVLLPTCSPDYQTLTSFNKLLRNVNKVNTKDLILGATYLSKKNQEMIYMGRYEKWSVEYGRSIWDRDKRRHIQTTPSRDVSEASTFVFVAKSDSKNKRYLHDGSYDELANNYTFHFFPSIAGKFISTVSTECVGHFAELFDLMESQKWFSPIDHSKSELIPMSFEEFDEITNNCYYYQVYGAPPAGQENNCVRGREGFETVETYYGSYPHLAAQFADKRAIFNHCKPNKLVRYLKNGKRYRGA